MAHPFFSKHPPILYNHHRVCLQQQSTTSGVTEDRYLSHNCSKQQIDNANVKLNKDNTNGLGIYNYV